MTKKESGVFMKIKIELDTYYAEQLRRPAIA